MADFSPPKKPEDPKKGHSVEMTTRDGDHQHQSTVRENTSRHSIVWIYFLKGVLRAHLVKSTKEKNSLTID